MVDIDQGQKGDLSGFDPVIKLDRISTWKRTLIVGAVLLIVIAVLMPGIFFQNKIFFVPDSKTPVSFASVGKEALDSGIYPLWNPYLFSGMPSFSSMAYNPYVYPLSWITHFLHKSLAFPRMTWLILHYFLAGVGIYLLLRSFGVLSSVSLISGVLFIMLPNYLAMGANGHGSKACAVAFMPFAVLFARRLLSGDRKIMMAGLLSLTLGVQMLRGHVQISYYTYLVVGLLFIFETVYLFRKGKKKDLAVNTILIFLSFIIAAGIASILIMPLKHYAQFSIRGGGAGGGLEYGYATSWSLHPKEMLTFVFPWAFGFGKMTYWGYMPFTDYPNYLGIVTALFSGAALFLIKTRWKWFLAITALLSTLLSFGKFFPLFGFMFKYFPYFNKFRVPVMVLIVQQLMVVVLMGLGIQKFVNLYSEGVLFSSKSRKVFKYSIIACAVVLFLVFVASSGIQERILNSRVADKVRYADKAAEGFTKDLITRIFLLTAVAAILLVASVKKIRKGYLILVLAAVLFLDLFLLSNSIIHPERTWGHEGMRIVKSGEEREKYKEPDEAIKFLKKDESFYRIFPAPAAGLGRWSHSVFPFSENKYMISGLFSTGGYHAAKLQIYQNVMDKMFELFNSRTVPLQILNMLNVKYIFSYNPLFNENATFPLVWKQGSKCIYENTRVLPRIFFVDRMKVLEPEKMLDFIASSKFNPAKQVLLEKPVSLEIGSAQGSHAEIKSYGLNSIKIDAHVENSCIMVLSEIYYPDWRVEVDGEEKEILRADYCLRALPLKEGDHKINFNYQPRVIEASLTLSIISFILSVFLSIAGFLIFRRKVG
ncbi:MAG: YfhO family protein [Candidatus Krumholzibacteriota bacterium]|nr:YfhO family protein [Candidatus Krumholzibacteriota bacterium]